MPDGSLGASDPRVGPDYIIPASIGRLEGANLFHSFARFRIASGESATFTGPPDVPVSNVVARVTGGEASEINGPLRVTLAGANLFLVNPAGVTFGPDARLDVGGAFVVSTADLVRFADGSTFHATLAAPPDLLSSAAPSAFGFLGAAPGRVEYTGGSDPTGGLVATPGRAISIVAGGVRIVGGRVLAPAGRVNVASVASPGDVTLDATSLNGAIDVAGFAQLGDVELLDGASLRAPSGGGIVVRGGSLRVEGSSLNADNDDTPGGGIDLDVRGALDVINGRIASDSFGVAPGGAIRIRAGDLTLRGFAPDGVVPPVSTNAAFNGAGGDIDINVSPGSISISENAAVTSFVQEGAAGSGGDIRLVAAGEVSIDGSNSIALTGLAAEAFVDSSGDSGDISIDAPVVRFIERGEMTSTTRGSGAAGELRVTAGQLLIDGRNAISTNPQSPGTPVITGLQSRVGRIGGLGATGAGGRIVVEAGVLRITDGGVLSATTFGRGAGGAVDVTAGDVEISATDPARFTGIFARTQLPQNGGAGGDLTLRADTLTLTGPAEISAAGTGTAPAGTLTVIAARSILLRDGASVSVSAGFPDARDLAPGETLGPPLPANAGALALAAPRVELRDGASIAARATLDSGQVSVTGGRFARVSRSSITAEAGREGGRIDLAGGAVVLERSVIRGRAGGEDVRVTVRSDALIRSASVIETDNLALPPEIDIAGNLARLPGGLVDPQARLLDICGQRFGSPSASSFISTGRGGTPLAPGGFAPSLRLGDGR